MQESFVNVFSKIDKFNNLGSFEGWVKRIAVNTSIQWLRKQKDFILVDNLQYSKDRDWTDHEHEDECDFFHEPWPDSLLPSIPATQMTVQPDSSSW